MYSGITQGLFPVVALIQKENLLIYHVQLNEILSQNLEIGASVSVDGVCQTVVSLNGHIVEFNAIDETLRKTTLSELQQGSLVSIERSLKQGSENGGHAMFGHVYGTAEIVEKNHRENNLEIVCHCAAEMVQYLFEKGFVGVDGSSLTVNKVDTTKNLFTINLIPHTLKVTNFLQKKVGDKVNIEVDANTVTIVETIKRLNLNQVTSSISLK